MKLYVKDINGKKIYLNVLASTRSELANLIGSPWFNLHGNQYHVHHVIAESDKGDIATGAIVGGLIGLLGGPVGVLLGGAIGGALGNENDKSEANKVSRFNQSMVQ